MQGDFHYFAVLALARTAGFPPDDALTVAYASQHVDYAIDSEPLIINGQLFKPLLTFHVGIGSLSSKVWKETYIPFHFLPPARVNKIPQDLVTRPGSDMAHQLARLALQEPNPLQKLVSLGVALHSLADSYSHQDFCGWNCRLNRVRDIKVKGKGRFKKLPMQDIDPSRILEVGHLQAWNLPDQPFRIFRYNAGPPDATVTVTRDNPTQFMLAAQAIYEYLVQASPEKDGAPAWQDISDRVARALLLPSEDKEERCAHWRKVFPQYFKEIDWEYDPRAWRWDAIERDDSFDADGDGSPIAPDPMYLWRGNPDTLPWVAFHWAAAKQRQWVREHMLS